MRGIETDASSPRQAERALALIRLAAPPVIFVGERLVDHPLEESAPFDAILAAATLYAVAAFAVAYKRTRFRIPGWTYVVLDLGFICALTYTSGGAFSQLRYAFFLVPLGAALLSSPLNTMAASLASILAFLAISLAHPAGDDFALVDFEIAQVIYLAWAGFAAVLLSQLLMQRNERIAALATSRRRLVAQVLDAEGLERRRLADALHDEAIQNLLAARQELASGSGSSADLELVQVGLDQTIAQLRDAVFDLHPYLLEHGGLSAALPAVAEREAQRGGYRVEVAVDPDATGLHDRLLFSIARELITNATRHSDARAVTVSVRRQAQDVVLEVADDGHGFADSRRDEALRSGHIGLASCAERVEAIGGSFEISSDIGRGTLVRATLPAHASLSAPRTDAEKLLNVWGN